MEEAEDYVIQKKLLPIQNKIFFTYFPEEGDDISAYLPVSDESVAR